MYAFRDVDHYREDLLSKAKDERHLANRKRDLAKLYKEVAGLPSSNSRRNEVMRNVRNAGGIGDIRSDIGHHASRAAAFELAAEMAKGIGILGEDNRLIKS